MRSLPPTQPYPREGVEGHPLSGEAGGLSGAPLAERSTEVIAQLSKALDGAIPIIGVGGIAMAKTPLQKLLRAPAWFRSIRALFTVARR